LDNTKHLSAKTTKKGGKVAPQIIGQAMPAKFCELINIKYTERDKLKEYIQNTTNGYPNISRILDIMVGYTFDCPILYYDNKKNTIRLIKLIKSINWNEYEYKWTRLVPNWKSSSTLKIKHTKKTKHISPDQSILPTKGKKILKPEYIAIAEFQFHSKRLNMANRWSFENFLTIFEDNFEIINL
jgi:hypothetical protein